MSSIGQRYNSPYVTAFNTYGVVSPGALLYFYITGTSTPANTYADAELQFPNSNPVEADAAGLFASIFLLPAQLYKVVLKTADGDEIWTADPVSNAGGALTAANLPGFIGGLQLGAAGGTATFSIAPGSASDSTASYLMTLAGAYNKTTAAWAVGTGMGSLDTGAIANSTWYHVYEIARLDTNIVDVIVSLSASAPALPSPYTVFRRIGSIKTDGSAHWIKFSQFGAYFTWATPLTDVSGVAVTTVQSAQTINVPTGIQVVARTRGTVVHGLSGPSSFVLSSAVESGLTTIANGAPSTTSTNANATDANVQGFTADVLTNTSAQVNTVESSGNPAALTMSAYGWIDLFQ